MKSNINIRSISAQETRPLRNTILRPNLPPETCIYPQDDSEDTLHAGAFIQDGLVGVATVYRESPPFQSKSHGWRLRGMAVTKKARRKGVGRALVNPCLAHIAGKGGGVVWCKARTIVLPFYQSLGFQTIGREFDVPESGPHFVMWQDVYNTPEILSKFEIISKLD